MLAEVKTAEWAGLTPEKSLETKLNATIKIVILIQLRLLVQPYLKPMDSHNK